MKIITLLLATVLVTSLSACAYDPAYMPPPGPEGSIAHEADYIKSVRDYVRQTRHWKDGSYMVVYRGYDGNNLLFAVINKETAAKMPAGSVGGDGASFYAEVDPGTKRVIHAGVME